MSEFFLQYAGNNKSASVFQFCVQLGIQSGRNTTSEVYTYLSIL